VAKTLFPASPSGERVDAGDDIINTLDDTLYADILKRPASPPDTANQRPVEPGKNL